VWESAGGTTRRWQDEVVVGDAFWDALAAQRTRPAPAPARHVSAQPGTSQFRIERANQTVTEQITSFLKSRELPRPRIELIGSDVDGGRSCDVVEATAGEVTYRFWVDSERLVVLRAIRLVDGQVAERIEFLDIAFDAGLSPVSDESAS
jgi:hypothetical protein